MAKLWIGVDITTGLSALLLTLLWRRQVQVRYVSGTVAFHMAAAFAGENKTDARDALVIAQTIRMRPDIPVLEPTDRLIAELTVLTGYRADLVGQRVATLFRLQELLTGISPALERAVDLNRKGPMMVLACWQIASVDDLIAEHLDQHPLAPIVTSLPGMGTLLTAELLVHTAGMTEYPTAAKLAAHAGLAPISRDSGTTSGNHRGPRRFHRKLRHILWMAAFTALRECPTSRAYYEKKRAEGKPHRQAMLALARRRVDVLWALVRDGKTFTRPGTPTTPASIPA